MIFQRKCTNWAGWNTHFTEQTAVIIDLKFVSFRVHLESLNLADPGTGAAVDAVLLVELEAFLQDVDLNTLFFQVAYTFTDMLFSLILHLQDQLTLLFREDPGLEDINHDIIALYEMVGYG